MTHQDKVGKYPSTMQDLAEEIGNLKYDALARFLELLSDKIKKDGDKDEVRGRVKLAGHLHECSAKLEECQFSIERAWGICEPYMK